MLGLPDQLTQWLREIQRATELRIKAGFTVTPSDARVALTGLTYAFGPKQSPLPLEQPLSIDGVSCQLFAAGENIGEAKPIMLFLHGGGHVAGSVGDYKGILRKIARLTDCRVVAVDYALAPEHAYPQGLNDARCALQGVHQALAKIGVASTEELYLVGDSAGGALAATLAIESSWQEHQISGLGLIYPSLDYTLSTPAIETYGEGYMLTRDRVRWYFDQYLQNGEDRRACSPLYMDVGPHLPPVSIVAADHCPLVDESRQWAEKLKTKNRPVRIDIVENSIHAALNLEKLCPKASNTIYSLIEKMVIR
ncbi:acetyl esterase/lipase [Sinobacterium caligoides]|uniref:Acetyl esterase/lipase n=1 Tax=Sinobacterium caligoides TaxID=933926 RepID=A0A3N2DPK4_9GAMM|nr:alpha/beta hydrolase fold domain-containing protein [Sinobacterium caligoides]ROS01716.1 acetyl esterase/lipase [Sinobacterium caligoides]